MMTQELIAETLGVRREGQPRTLLMPLKLQHRLA
jgi:hypothetical protein